MKKADLFKIQRKESEKMAEISIIIPVYNSEKYIEKCLRSVTAQTMSDIEIICVDDGSSDGSAAIMKKMAMTDSRIRVYEQKNSGPAAARNVGLTHASGKYLMFCDSDDTYNSKMCEIMHRKITENDVDLVCCRATVTSEDGIAERKEGITYYSNYGLSGVYDAYEKEVIPKVNVLLWNKIFKRDIVVRFGISFPTGHKCDDDAFVFQYYAMINRVMFIEDTLYNYLQRKNSIIDNEYAKRSRDYFDCIYAAKHYYDFVVRHGIALSEHSYACMVRMLESVRWHIDMFCDNDADRKKCDSMIREFFPEKYLALKGKCLHSHSFLKFLTLEVWQRFIFGKGFTKRLVVRIGSKKLFSVSKRFVPAKIED